MTLKIKYRALSLLTLTLHFVCSFFTLLLSSLVSPPPSIVVHVAAHPPSRLVPPRESCRSSTLLTSPPRVASYHYFAHLPSVVSARRCHAFPLLTSPSPPLRSSAKCEALRVVAVCLCRSFPHVASLVVCFWQATALAFLLATFLPQKCKNRSVF